MATNKAMKEAVRVIVYRWAGQKGFLHIHSECAECDLTVAKVQSLVAEHPEWPVSVEVKPWLTYLWESLRRGGWHAPVTLVDGRVVRQGAVPTKVALEVAVEKALARRGLRPLAQPNSRRTEATLR